MKSDRRTVGRYEILRPIGQGAMATVHLAHQPDLDRRVALKELDRFGGDESAVFAARFLREARVAGSLSHANIVTVYEYFEHDRRPYIAMEYVEGGSLREHIDGLSLGQIIGVLDGVLAGLTQAEARAIIHRDIKPENLLVTADGHVKIADFGIASAYSLMPGALLTSTGASLGTPLYMAPEQATGEPLGAATDLYAVGIVAFEMLFGYAPFQSAQTPMAIIWQHVNEPVPDPRALRPELGPRICSWLEGLLAKDPGDRPASAAQARDALEEIAFELLGSHWRRQAPLQPRVAPSPAVGDRLLAPQSGGPVAPEHDDPGATHGAGDGTGAPDAAASSAPAPAAAIPDRALPVADARERRRPWPALALVLAAALLATGGGYIAFHRDPPAPVVTPSARFEDRLARAFARLNQVRISARGQMAAATDAGARKVQARRVANAYDTTALALHRLTPAAAQRAAVALAVEKLLRAAEAYNDLAKSGATPGTRGLVTKSHVVAVREAAVQRAVAQMTGNAAN